MSEESHIGPPGASHHRCFENTHWSQIRAARQAGNPLMSRNALESLCRSYWYPLYVYIRRRGHSPDDAQDLTQAFFCHFLERNLLGIVDPGKGRFRSFLLGSLNKFLSHARQHDLAQKRGGGRRIFSLNAEDPERHYVHEPATKESPELAFERNWARTLLQNAMKRLRDDYLHSGKGELYKHLRGCLAEPATNEQHRKVAAKLGMTPGAVAVAAHRMRQRYRELIRDEIAHTVAAEEVEEEYHYLRSLLVA